jgi:hypothetical protein
LNNSAISGRPPAGCGPRSSAEASRREGLLEALGLQSWGTGLFIFGVWLSVGGNAVTC